MMPPMFAVLLKIVAVAIASLGIITCIITARYWIGTVVEDLRANDREMATSGIGLAIATVFGGIACLLALWLFIALPI